jgi:uncharacterized membrane protein
MRKNGNKLGRRKQIELMGPLLPSGQIGRQGVARGQGDLVGQVVQHESFSIQQGPLPPPDALAQYERVFPGLAERIVTMAETQSRHRQTLEVTSAKTIADDAAASRQERRRGQTIGAIVVVTAIAATTALGIWGQSAWANVPGAVLGGASLCSLVYVFMTGKRYANKEPRAQPTSSSNPDA